MVKNDRRTSNHDKSNGGLADAAAAIDAHGNAVLRLALCRTGNKADAEDVFQTVFLRLHQRAPILDSDEHLKSWLLRVTTNCCNDLYRDIRKRQHVPLDEAMSMEGTCGFPDEDMEHLRQAVSRLPETQRAALHLFYVEGYATDEIALIIGEKPGTVRAHLHRARKTLKTALEGGCHA